MKKYELKGGGFIEATTPLDIIQAIRSTSLNPCENLVQFMVQVSKSCYADDGSNIRTGSYKDFVDDLIKNNFIKEVPSE
jgi:hypothetical protein